MRLLALDPASNKFGLVGINFNEQTKDISIYVSYLLTSPKDFSTENKSRFMAHALAGLISIDKPDTIVSEKPWGQGFSKDSLVQLIGMIKAENWLKIYWQGVSEARKAVLGDGFGGAKKRPTAEWLLSYPWDRTSKNLISGWIEKANPDTDDGYDELDALLHGMCHLIQKCGLVPVHKEAKKKRGKKNV
jgi:hypothetical protein